MNYRSLLLALVLTCSLLAFTGPGHSQAQPAEQLTEIAPGELPVQRDVSGAVDRALQTRQQLQQIQNSMVEKRLQLDRLRGQLAGEADNVDTRDLQRLIEQEETDLTNLQRSFENIALGGLDLSVFNPEQQDAQFNWQQELQTILKPVFQKLNELTEKPRQMERLNNQLALMENQRRIAQRALTNVEQLQNEDLNEATRLRLDVLHQTWTRRLNDIQRETDISQLQLNLLVDEDETVLEKVRQAMNEFITGTGLNLALSIGTFVFTVLLMRGVYTLYTRVKGRGVLRASTGGRMLAYGYQALTFAISFLAALVVLYLLGDMLLLVLALVLLMLVLLGMRNYLPSFLDEIKVLLNVGAVREHERVTYNGLPWMVRSLGVYTYLYNPALEGMLRLPLPEVLPLVSRPCREDEPWFPSRTGDWVKISDGIIGQVLCQTPETVQLRVRGAIRNYVTSNYLVSEPQNLSSGFGVSVTFGIDYKHQAISTTEVPKILRQAVEQALQRSGQGKYVENILVEFQEAASSSLNYLIYVNMKGEAADSYYTLGRLLQRICVDTCNEHGWVIPFEQLTVHAGSGFGVDKLP